MKLKKKHSNYTHDEDFEIGPQEPEMILSYYLGKIYRQKRENSPFLALGVAFDYVIITVT